MNPREKADMGSRLRELRKRAGMSQMKLADKVGVSYQQIQKYEKGTSALSVPRLLQLSEVFQVPFESIIYDSVPPSKSVAATNFSDEEVDMILSFRRIKSRPLRFAIIAQLNAIVKAMLEVRK